MIGRAQVIEFADFWTEGSCLLANSFLRIPSNRKPTTTTHQSPGRDELAVFEDRRHRVTDGQCGEPLASTDEVRLTKNESGPITTPPFKKSGVNFFRPGSERFRDANPKVPGSVESI